MVKQVLVVDDEQDQRNLMRDILEVSGFDVSTAINGQDALNQLTAHAPPALIFLDITMPIMSGRELLDAMHSGHYPYLEAVPVVIISAIADFLQLERYNCVSVIRKPADIESIIEIAHAYTYTEGS